MRLGAYDYLTKPATLDEMEAVIRKADEKRRLVQQNASLRSVVRMGKSGTRLLKGYTDTRRTPGTGALGLAGASPDVNPCEPKTK